MTIPYISANELKTYLGVTGTGDDALLQSLIDQATSAIENHTHRQFTVVSDTTQYIDAVGLHIVGRSLFLADIGDIFQITSIVNGDGVTVTSGQYTLYPKTKTAQNPVYNEIRLLLSSGLYWTYEDDYENAIAITGRWGYSEQVPAAIKQAALRLASFYYRQKDQPLFDVTTVEAGVVISPQGIPNDVKLVLEPYVRR